ncbi:MAG: peptidoglycan DD-metalloendopeptidase family protein, partial [Bacillota bacterium]
FGRMDRLGSVKAWQRYPFGEGNESSTNDEYATYPIDRSTGHYYAWNRFYSATWGRFSSPNPYVMSSGLTNPQGWNRYSYVGNDPVNYNDPEGLFALRPGFGNGPTLGGPAWGPVPTVPDIWSVLPGVSDLMSAVARFWDDSDLLPDPGTPEWAKPGPAQLCGVNPVTGKQGIANRETGTAGQLRPSVGGSGRFGATRTTVRNRITIIYPHTGVDIAGVAGESSVYASLGGEVIFAGETRDGGNTVIVDIGGGYRMTYMHLESLSVATGDWVAKGQALGVLGQTGNAAGQPASEAHVHFEIRDRRRAVDPIRFLNSPCPPGVRNP